MARTNYVKRSCSEDIASSYFDTALQSLAGLAAPDLE